MGTEQVLRFHLTSVSQHDHHASVQINGQVVLLDQLRGNKAMAGAPLSTKATNSSS